MRRRIPDGEWSPGLSYNFRSLEKTFDHARLGRPRNNPSGHRENGNTDRDLEDSVSLSWAVSGGRYQLKMA